ncbi:hypothetical protein KC323_g108 [Hortaea werneckii]|nr:hypothetical protein KC323_g108 [Hortaea werneckii]
MSRRRGRHLFIVRLTWASEAERLWGLPCAPGGEELEASSLNRIALTRSGAGEKVVKLVLHASRSELLHFSAPLSLAPCLAAFSMNECRNVEGVEDREKEL